MLHSSFLYKRDNARKLLIGMALKKKESDDSVYCAVVDVCRDVEMSHSTRKNLLKS